MVWYRGPWTLCVHIVVPIGSYWIHLPSPIGASHWPGYLWPFGHSSVLKNYKTASIEEALIIWPTRVIGSLVSLYCSYPDVNHEHLTSSSGTCVSTQSNVWSLLLICDRTEHCLDCIIIHFTSYFFVGHITYPPGKLRWSPCKSSSTPLRQLRNQTTRWPLR